MTYSAEFIVNTGQFEHVKLTISDEDFLHEFANKDADLHVLLGDYHASLKAAVLFGRDQALGKVTQSPPPEDLIKSELGATVIETVVHEQPKEPWKRPQKAAEPKAWESAPPAPAKPVQQGLEDF